MGLGDTAKTTRRFVLCFDNHAANGRVWAVRVGRTWRTTRNVACEVPIETIYRGATARQPRAYLIGRGVVRGGGILLRITER